MPVKVITSTIPLGESFPDHMEKQKVDNTRDLKTISDSYQISKSMINDDNNNNNNNYNKLNNRVQENKKSDNEIKSDTTKLTNNTYNASQNKQRKFLWMEFETPLIWLNIISILGFHLVAAWGFICFPYISRFPISLYTVLWGKSSISPSSLSISMIQHFSCHLHNCTFLIVMLVYSCGYWWISRIRCYWRCT